MYNSDESMKLVLKSSDPVAAPLETSDAAADGGRSKVKEEEDNGAALAALLESSDADALLETSNANALAALFKTSESIAAEDSSDTIALAALLESSDSIAAEDSSDTTAVAALLESSESMDETYHVLPIPADVEILNSDSDSEILMVNPNMVILT